jgi:cell surface protein SprA
VDNIAAFTDSTGLWPPDLFDPDQDGDYDYAFLGQGRWNAERFEILLDEDGRFVALNLRRQHSPTAVLAVVYDVVDDQRDLLYRVGDRPLDPPPIEIGGESYYRMKLLKPPVREPYTWQYAMRNIYYLGRLFIDPEWFDLRLEIEDYSLEHPEQDTSTLPWIRIFGLDGGGKYDDPPDGQVDKDNPFLFDFQRGLLLFPPNFPEPFNAPRDVYEAYADTSAFIWEESLLMENRSPEIYDWTINPVTYHQYSRFRFVASYARTSKVSPDSDSGSGGRRGRP